MSNKIKKNLIKQHRLDFLNSHPRPTTRREFLALGMMGFSAMAMPLKGVPFFKQTFAQETNLLDLPPFLVFDCAGGAGLPGNFLVGKAGGPEDLLSSYSQMGWNPKKDGWDAKFGLPLAKAAVSKIMQGIEQTCSPAAQARIRFSSLCHVSRDDTSSNPLSALSLIAKSGFFGSLLTSGLGTRSSSSGGNSQMALADDMYKPFFVDRVSNLSQLQGLGGPWDFVKSGGAIDLVNAVAELGNLQAKNKNNVLLGAKYQNNSQDIAGRLKNLVSVDPRGDAGLFPVFNIDANTAQTDQRVVFASVIMNTLKRHTGPGVLTFGGCDYHDSTQATGDAKDLEIGQYLGRAFQTAHLFQKPLFVQIITDGGVYARENTRIWQGDSGDKSMTVFGYYHPTKMPTHINKKIQIGNYVDGQGVDRSTLIGDKPIMGAYVTLANYLNVAGKIDLFNKVAPGIFSTSELDKVLSLTV